MHTIIIRYLESVVDGEGKISHVLVGAESYEGIKEAYHLIVISI